MPFDLQAHRGGAGLHPENTLEAFAAALALGVSTLELDVHLTRDDDVVVAHDPSLADARLIRRLSRAELPPTMPLLREVAALLRERGADTVGINLEIKYDAVAAAALTSRQRFVEVVLDAIRIDSLVGRTSVQCFDWTVLGLVRDTEPALALNLLVSPRYLGSPGRPSPWLGDVVLDEGAGGFVAAAAAHGCDAISPIHGSPYLLGVTDPGYRPWVDAAMVTDAHERGLRVVPYVVDDAPTMAALVELGVDGLITNYPDRLRSVLAAAGRELPPAFP